MGVSFFRHEVTGYSAKEVFRDLVDQAVAEDGSDAYNGTISTCDLTKTVVISKVYSDEEMQKAEDYIKYIDNHDGCRKWEATCLDLGVISYDLLEVKKEPVKNTTTPVWKQKYVIYNGFLDGELACKDTFDRKVDAEKAVMKLALEHPDQSYVISKRPVNLHIGSDVVMKVSVKVTTGKSGDPRPKAKAGMVVKERHMYLFFGYAGI